MQESNKKFQQNNPNYSSIDSGPQTFFYTLTNMLKLHQAKNILQVGCGAGKLLSTIIDLKKQSTFYYATDVSEKMVKQSKTRLYAHFMNYESNLNFQDWLKKHNFQFGVENGEDIQKPIKFDRIISNMVLCHADDPQKMLKNWHSISQQNCLIGLSLLGDPNKNHFVRGIRQSIVQAGEKLPQGNPPYYWYDKIQKIVENSGWEIVLVWEQNGVFPFLNKDQAPFKNMIEKKVPEKARQHFNKRIDEMFEQNKTGVQFFCKAIIARKRS